MNNKALPYKILTLAPFAPMPDQKVIPNFISVDINSIDDAVNAISPVLHIPISGNGGNRGSVTLEFHKIRDFSPRELTGKLPKFHQSPSAAAMPAMTQNEGLADRAVNEILSRSQGSESPQDSTIDDILSMVDITETGANDEYQSERESREEKSSSKKIQGDTTGHPAIKHIFSDPVFRKIESAWRGLHIMTKRAAVKGSWPVEISISCIPHNPAGSSTVIDGVLDGVKNMAHDKMPNLVLMDMGIDNTIPCLEILEQIIHFADTMMVPVVLSINPNFFHIDKWNDLSKLPYLRHHIDDASHAGFKKLKSAPGAEWTMLCANGIAVRPPHPWEDGSLFVSPVWAVGTLCAKAVTATGWPMEFTRYNHFQIVDLATDLNNGKYAASTCTLISDDRLRQFNEIGITPVAGVKNRDVAFIPMESSLTGGTIKFQMFMNRIIECLVNARESAKNDAAKPSDTAQIIDKALSDCFVNSGQQLPGNLRVEHLPANEDEGKSPVRSQIENPVLNESNALTSSENDSPDRSQRDSLTPSQKRDEIFHISFKPPEGIMAGSSVIEFTFIW
ncbi:MAG: type VI secretion system contractile sheath large subunit [Desulfamplus sp.]|nr:type VI secretion system contractile sheath large subunit [Desulfamplus sp.]